jgi:hypothetical protein
VLILVILAGIWRLMQGPVELNWLAPYVEAGFDRADMGVKVAVAGVSFGIDRNTHQLDLWAENVRLAQPDGTPLARFPEMSTSIALSEMLRGRIEPTQVTVEHPVLHLTREATGMVSAQIGAGDAPASEIGPGLLQQLVGPAQRKQPFGMLRHVNIRGATLVVDDQASGRTWRANRVDIAVQRDAQGLRGDLSFAVPIGNSMPEVRANYRYLAGQHLLDVELAIDGVQPSEIPPLIPELAQLQHIEAPISGTLQTRIDTAAWQPQGSRLDLTLGAGKLHSEWLPTGTAVLNKGELHAVYAPERNEMRLDRLTLDLDGGTQLAAQGTLTGVTPQLLAAPTNARPAGHIGGNIDAALKNVPASRLAELWPTAFSAGGRRWVLANVHDGVLDEAVIHAGIDLDPVTHTGELYDARGTLRYHDLTVNYFHGLPPVRKVSGTARFTGEELDFTPTSGVLKGLSVSGGSLRLTDLSGPVEHLTVDLTLTGPLRDALEVIDSKPLQWAHSLGISPARVGGKAETQLHFKLPLLADLKMDAVEYGAKATLTGASLDKALLDRPVSDGNVALDVTRAGAHAQGTMRFDGIPAKIDASVSFHEKSGPRSVYKVGLTLDDEARQRLGLDFAPQRLNGPIGVEATYQAFADKRGEATAILDLRDATMAMPEAGWHKSAAQPATAKIALDVDDEKITDIREIDVRAAGLDGHFTASLGADRKHLARVDIRRLIVGGSDVSGVVWRRADGWHADIRAARIDARHALKNATTSKPSANPPPPLTVSARINELVFGPQRELRQVSAVLSRRGGEWRSARIDAQFANGHRLALRYGENGSQHLLFQSQDLGATVRLLDMGSDVTGGQLTVNGTLSEANGKRLLRAHVEGSNYTITHASPMTRILALPSFTGFASMLSGTGLPFMTLRGDFSYSGNRLIVDRMLAFGEAIGLTANGWFDLDRDQLELQGTVAPAYALNSIIGNVPIIGQLLGGGSQGLFAANFRLSGPSGDPHVTVNPLSALAPGILRQIFSPIVGLPPPPQPPQQRQQAAQ